MAPAKDFRGQSAFSKDKDACKRQDQFYGDRLSALAMCEMDFGSVLSVRGGAVPGGPPRPPPCALQSDATSCTPTSLVCDGAGS